MEFKVCKSCSWIHLLNDLSFTVVPMRLVIGNSRSGRVEFFFNRFWGTICDRGWNEKASTVICRQMGLGSTGTFKDYDGAAPAHPVHLDRVRCNGSEPNILACSHDRIGWRNCLHIRDVGVTCSGLYS